MSNKFTSDHYRDRLGYYLVGNKKFFNKTVALIEAKKRKFPTIFWVFNDSIYSKYDWSIPVETSLTELYRCRAQQLRNEYDYLMLYFSGGADSLNILHAFLDNDIFIDEIVMQMPKPYESQVNGHDRSNNNWYSEIQYSAVPLLNKFQNKLSAKTKITFQDWAKPLIEVLQKDDWFDRLSLGTNITISGIGRPAASIAESHVLKLGDRNKHIAQILGIDKPIVWFNNGNYYAYFSDVSAQHFAVIDATKNQSHADFYHTEWFYWTPDLPEIVIKQAQEIKQYCELNPIAKELVSNSDRVHIGNFRDLLHSIIYPPYISLDFQTAKASSNIFRTMDQWFWEVADDKTKNNYLCTIKNLASLLDPKDLLTGDIVNGLKSHQSRMYKL